jgi:uncharacterized membrane protein (DUF2068 family)
MQPGGSTDGRARLTKVAEVRERSEISHHRGLVIIGCFKLVKAVGLLVVGLGLLSLIHRDVAATLEVLVEQLRIDPHNRFIHTLVEKSLGVRPRMLEQLGVGTLFYAGLFAVEGIGLIMAKRWAEYMTLAVTISFLPLEVYEFGEHRSVVNAAVILVNIAVAVYLWRLVRRPSPQAR